MPYMPEDFKARLSEDTRLINDWLEDLLPDEDDEIINIVAAMDYSVMAGGKRLRPILMYELYSLLGGDSEAVFYYACALECIHSYSLVHDDLPAMDDDLLRRGLPTTHAKYGEATAILAGDALLTYAFELASCGATLLDDPSDAVAAIRILAKYAGYQGMIGGQVLDLDGEGRGDIGLDDILRIYSLKTGRLLSTAFSVGAILAGDKSEDVLDDMYELGDALGIAFQIQDDILDVIGDEGLLGKPIGSDDRNEKVTCLRALGMEGARELAKKYTDRAVSIIKKYEPEPGFICSLIVSLIERRS